MATGATLISPVPSILILQFQKVRSNIAMRDQEKEPLRDLPEGLPSDEALDRVRSFCSVNNKQMRIEFLKEIYAIDLLPILRERSTPQYHIAIERLNRLEAENAQLKRELEEARNLAKQYEHWRQP
jgi:hypothetical protein